MTEQPGMTPCPAGDGAHVDLGQAAVDVAAALEAARANEREKTAQRIANEIRAELVCCDIYEQLSKERDERRWRTGQTKGHDLCYWGEAAARIADEAGRAISEGER